MSEENTALDQGQNTLFKNLRYQHPVKEDGQKLWHLVKESGTLDLNSAYCYLMLCEYFRNTCMAAWINDRIVGFVSGYLLPEANDTLFVWQVTVAHEVRGRGIGKQLIMNLLNSETGKKVRRIQATVSPSNTASNSLFSSVAEELKTSLRITEGFGSNIFPGGDHEREDLLTIGPFK